MKNRNHEVEQFEDCKACDSFYIKYFDTAEKDREREDKGKITWK